ncbi:MAG: hypothetical protein UT05_C0009G0026 [Parcubacteria group bacterium GW2011_GWF2_38_76]|nr:MAG: hypothetical protein UT05_C0009G0026 [Parcubacteria group bacterium GW2011_GWF2_38_76]HBM45467.1 hypothetical protein [Patescibacteria group bacterium]
MKNPFRGRKPHSLIKFLSKPKILKNTHVQIRTRLFSDLKIAEKRFHLTAFEYLKFISDIKQQTKFILSFLGF